MLTAQLASASWCHAYKYEAVPQFAGCGYKPGNEDFTGSVTEVTLYHSESDSMLLFKGDTKGTGVKLQKIAPLTLWKGNYKLRLAFTMPKDLDEIGEYAALLGSETGGHPYPYFNQQGFYYEIQNGPHPRKAVLGLGLFKGGHSYVVIISHSPKNGENCFSMTLFGKRRSRLCDVNVCSLRINIYGVL